MYIRMGHQYAEEAAERRNRPFARPSDSEAEAIGRKVRSMQQQEMTDINPERKPDSADDYIWDTGKLILGGAADGSLATVQGISTMTAAGLRKYRPDSENAQASARAADELSRDLGQLREAYANTYKVNPVYADHAVGKVASFVGQTLPYVASYALGAPGIIFTTYFQCFQNNWDDAEESARRNGVRFDPDRAFNYAITVSTADAILSAIPAGRAASPWLKGKSGDIIRKNFLELLKKTSTEGAISAVQGGVQDAAASHYKIDDRNPFDLQNRTFDFVVGGGTAAPFSFDLTPQHPPTLHFAKRNSPQNELEGFSYEDASYHKDIPAGQKSPRPTNGKELFLKSIRFKDTTTRRIAVDVEANEIVIFDQSGKDARKFHGHVRDWIDLPIEIKNALIKEKMTNRKGKIIRTWNITN